MFFCSVIITGASFYSRAWSYHGYYLTINKTVIIVFNILVIAGSILAYYLPTSVAVGLKMVGSIAGLIGVMVCVSETLYLVKSPKLNKSLGGSRTTADYQNFESENNCFMDLIHKIRLLDLVSLVISLLTLLLYWLTSPHEPWIVNDILAVCTIITCIKILKIKSLKDGTFMLFSLLII